MAYTSEQLLDAIKRGVTVPANQYRFTDSDFLKFADEEIESTILPMLISIRQEFLVKQKDVSVVANQAKYKIPYRAVGRKLRDLKLATTDGTFIRILPYVTPEDRQSFLPISQGEPRGFTVEGEYIVLLPTPTSATYVMQMFYELAPSDLVTADEAATITAINTTTGEVTVATMPTTFASAQVMDFIDGKTGNANKGEDITNVSVAGSIITFTAADLPDDLAVGDYVSLSGESPVVQLPNELIQSLVQAVICRLLEAQGDFEGLTAGIAKLEKKMKAAAQLLTPRVEGILPVMINRNGLLNQRPFSYRYRMIT